MDSQDLLLAQAVYLQRVLERWFVRLLLPRRFRTAILTVAEAAEHRVRASAAPISRAPAVGAEVMVRFRTSTFDKRGLTPGSRGTVVDHAPSPIAPLEPTAVVDWGDGAEPKTEDLFNLMKPPRSIPTW